jgi:hypothetical protein
VGGTSSRWHARLRKTYNWIQRRKGTWLIGLCGFLIMVALQIWSKKSPGPILPPPSPLHIIVFGVHSKLQLVSAESKQPVDVDVGLALEVKATNISHNPVEIMGYRLVGRTRTRAMELEHIKLPGSKYLVCPAEGSCIDISTKYLDEKARSAVIQPGYSVEGWMFFRGRCSNHKVLFEGLELTILDSTEVNTTVEVHPISDEQRRNLFGSLPPTK